MGTLEKLTVVTKLMEEFISATVSAVLFISEASTSAMALTTIENLKKNSKFFFINTDLKVIWIVFSECLFFCFINMFYFTEYCKATCTYLFLTELLDSWLNKLNSKSADTSTERPP